MLKLIQKAVRKFFGENNGLYYWLVRFEYRWHPPLMNIEKMFDEYANVVKQVTFIQVGANDGKSGDPLFRYVTEKNWQGIMVEPVQFLFKQLLQTYARQQEKIFFVNAAIGKEKGKQIFYRLRRSSEINAPQWYDQLGSFNKEVLLKHKTDIPNIELLLIEEEVQTVTISELMQTYGYETVDCLHIDTEGYDYEIIKTFPFNLTKPGLILLNTNIYR